MLPLREAQESRGGAKVKQKMLPLREAQVVPVIVTGLRAGVTKKKTNASFAPPPLVIFFFLI
jgi:hypothetical protein